MCDVYTKTQKKEEVLGNPKKRVKKKKNKIN